AAALAAVLAGVVAVLAGVVAIVVRPVLHCGQVLAAFGGGADLVVLALTVLPPLVVRIERDGAVGVHRRRGRRALSCCGRLVTARHSSPYMEKINARHTAEAVPRPGSGGSILRYPVHA